MRSLNRVKINISDRKDSIHEMYVGTKEECYLKFEIDKDIMEQQGYVVSNEIFISGEHGCFWYTIAIILAPMLIGIIMLIGSIFIKPEDTLSVTFSLKEKICPICAELIKYEALKCKYCGEKFNQENIEKREEFDKKKDEMIQKYRVTEEELNMIESKITDEDRRFYKGMSSDAILNKKIWEFKNW